MYRETLLFLLLTLLTRFDIIISKKSIINGRIIGGEEAKIEDFPYQVSLLLDGVHYCGGSIIKSDVILTAAQCVMGKTFVYTIRYGSSYLNDGRTVAVKRILSHPNFNFPTFDYDIALLFLEEEIQFSSSAKPIALAWKAPNVGSLAVVTGWGLTVPDDINSLSTVLQKVQVNIIDRAACRLQFNDGLTDRMFCAGVDDGSKDACNGDIGGPMVNENVLIGIFSWDYYCARPTYSSIYSNVSEFLPWIIENTGIELAKIAFL